MPNTDLRIQMGWNMFTINKTSEGWKLKREKRKEKRKLLRGTQKNIF